MSVTLPAVTDTGPNVTRAVRQIADGSTNTRGQITLAQGQTQTAVPDPRAADGIMVVVMPRSAAAAALGLPWLSAAAQETFTLSHPQAGAGCLYDYEIRR